MAGFRVLVAGGTGQVGVALVKALLARGDCLGVVMVNRRAVDPPGDRRVRVVVMETGAADFADRIEALARSLMAQGEPVYAASCIGIGQGSARWSEQAMRDLEVGVVGAFAGGCRAAGIGHFALLSAVGADRKSWIRYARIMGEKEDAVRDVNFARLSILRPGIIAGNAHTPGWVAALGRLLPGAMGTIDQAQIAQAFIGEFLNGGAGVRVLHNRQIRG